MKVYHFKDMIRGWFVGNFKPTSFSTKDCEVALQKYKAGDYEAKHVHKIATEITFISKGQCLMNGVKYSEGDIIVLEPGDATDFKALTDVENIVVKIPSVKGDKHIIDEQKSKAIILTHRGLEPTNNDFFPESSYEAFKNHLGREFNIEFDLCFSKDRMIVSHDSSLKRITNSKDEREFKEIYWDELKEIKYGKKRDRIPTLIEVFDLIKNSNSTLNALHVKGKYQEKQFIVPLIQLLRQYKEIIPRTLIFDLKPETARYIKQNLPGINLAPSVAHEYDIKRYNNSVNGTLISLEEAMKYKQEGIYDWVWLDEWDLTDENNQAKKLYTKENFELLKKVGYKIALVTPELHGTSPGLYGGESHQDAKNKKTLFKRIKEIINLKPDAVCTDYPEEVSKF